MNSEGYMRSGQDLGPGTGGSTGIRENCVFRRVTAL